MNDTPRLTQYSHGAGCGCKIAPDVLATILGDRPADSDAFPGLLVGHDSHDDAAAIDLGDGRAILSTTDFFMPIVDDPFDFGRVAATNAISDIFAMGGRPIAAIAILGWPVDKLDPKVAADVIAGGRHVCSQLGFPLAGGHSIDCPEPIFGLAVTGEVALEHLKRNNTGQPGDRLYLTKPLGIGILTTAEKQGKLLDRHRGTATDLMCRSNKIGRDLAKIAGVHAMTDITGFGLVGHLRELCEGAGLSAQLDFEAIPRVEGLATYIDGGCVPGGTARNFRACASHLAPLDAGERAVLCDPQTSGGLLLAVAPDAAAEVEQRLAASELPHHAIGYLAPATAENGIYISLQR